MQNMDFKITSKAKDFIAAQGNQITVKMEIEDTCACCGPRKTSFLSVRSGKPEELGTKNYAVVFVDGIKVYVHNSLEIIVTPSQLVIDLDSSFSELVIYGVVP